MESHTPIHLSSAKSSMMSSQHDSTTSANFQRPESSNLVESMKSRVKHVKSMLSSMQDDLGENNSGANKHMTTVNVR